MLLSICAGLSKKSDKLNNTSIGFTIASATCIMFDTQCICNFEEVELANNAFNENPTEYTIKIDQN